MTTTQTAPRQPGPLEGVRVLDLSRFVAGPYCAMILGDMGADVVKLTGSAIIDYTTGMYAAMGVLAALNARHVNGEGQLVDVALLDSAVSLMLSAIPDRAVGGIPLERNGNRDRFSAPGNTFATGDGRWVLLTVADEKMFENLARAMGRPDLPRDPRFADRTSRVANVEAIEAEVTQWTRSLSADAVVLALEKAGVPCAKVATIDEMIANPQLRHRGQIAEVAHPGGARIPIQGVTMRLSQTPLSIRRALPHLGEHTAEVLAEWLDLADGEVEALRRRQVV